MLGKATAAAISMDRIQLVAPFVPSMTLHQQAAINFLLCLRFTPHPAADLVLPPVARLPEAAAPRGAAGASLGREEGGVKGGVFTPESVLTLLLLVVCGRLQGANQVLNTIPDSRLARAANLPL